MIIFNLLGKKGAMVGIAAMAPENKKAMDGVFRSVHGLV
jgi:hypothetical protein